MPTLWQGELRTLLEVSLIILALYIVPDGLSLAVFLALKHFSQDMLLGGLVARPIAWLACCAALVSLVLGDRLVLVDRCTVPLGLGLLLLGSW